VPGTDEEVAVRKFKVNDRVRVHSDSPSPYRGSAGVVQQELPEDSHGFWYAVRFEFRDLRTTVRFLEQDLDLVSDRRPTES